MINTLTILFIFNILWLITIIIIPLRFVILLSICSYLYTAGFFFFIFYFFFYFFIYTLLGSLFFIIAIFFIYFEIQTTNIIILSINQFSLIKQLLVWFLFFITFAIKIPIFPFHIWLPEAHVEAPTIGSVILAG